MGMTPRYISLALCNWGLIFGRDFILKGVFSCFFIDVTGGKAELDAGGDAEKVEKTLRLEKIFENHVSTGELAFSGKHDFFGDKSMKIEHFPRLEKSKLWKKFAWCAEGVLMDGIIRTPNVSTIRDLML